MSARIKRLRIIANAMLPGYDQSQVREAADELERLAGLVRTAKCPNCDGQGHYLTNLGSTDAELQQCQWCDEAAPYRKDA